MYMPEEILVTGHKGFIGSHVFRHLMNKGYQCYGADIKSGKDIRTCSLPSCDIIIHLAGLAGVRKSKDNPDEYWSVNVDGSKKVFEHAQKWGAKVLYASSSSAKQWPTSPYATTKRAMEAIAPDNTIGMRFHTVYGLDSRPDMMYRMLIDNTAKYMTRHTRDFTHINDVVSAIDLLINNYDSIESRVVDIGTGNPVAVPDLVKAADIVLPFKEVDGEQEHSKADNSLIRSLGWSPKHNVLDEIKNDILQKYKVEKSSIDW